jgi:hypothetical protein
VPGAHRRQAEPHPGIDVETHRPVAAGDGLGEKATGSGKGIEKPRAFLKGAHQVDEEPGVTHRQRAPAKRAAISAIPTHDARGAVGGGKHELSTVRSGLAQGLNVLLVELGQPEGPTSPEDIGTCAGGLAREGFQKIDGV